MILQNKYLSPGQKSAHFRDVRLLLNLIDVNDQIPVFQGLDEIGQYPASVFETEPVGTSVLQVTATDDDGPGKNSEVSCFFFHVWDLNMFFYAIGTLSLSLPLRAMPRAAGSLARALLL